MKKHDTVVEEDLTGITLTVPFSPKPKRAIPQRKDSGRDLNSSSHHQHTKGRHLREVPRTAQLRRQTPVAFQKDRRNRLTAELDSSTHHSKTTLQPYITPGFLCKAGSGRRGELLRQGSFVAGSRINIIR